jgi:indolepyruvate ferredoxin oxidoreductase alpha subunit
MPADATLEMAAEAGRGDPAAEPATRPMTGNEAIARGAWEAGVKVAAAYPPVVDQREGRL